MKPIAVAFTGPHTVGFAQEAHPPLPPDAVRIRTLFSGISAGTELTAFRGTNPYLHKRWEQPTRLFANDPAHQSLEYPVVGWGYEEVGQVIDVGAQATDVPVGSVVYGTWGHRTHHTMSADLARARILPPDAEPILGVFSQIGAIALNGILDAAIRLGETVAVFGLGVVGQLVAQLARLSGAEVIGVDPIPFRRDMATRLGCQHVLDASSGAVAQTIKTLTDNRGADVCIEASGAAPALHEAIRACAYSSKVVALGFFQGEATGLRLGEEFHHNRINIVCSQISGRAPELQHRWDTLRLVHTFMRLAVRGDVDVQLLITHQMAAGEAPALFALLDERPAEALQAVLDFREPLSAALVDDREEQGADAEEAGA